MMGSDKELRQLCNQAEIAGHVGWCMRNYKLPDCAECEVEFECLKLFIKETAEVQSRTLAKMREVQDGRTES